MQPQSLVFFLSEINDIRKERGKRHPQLVMLVIMIMAMLCGKTTLKSIARFAKTHRSELAEYLPLPRGKAPSYSTFQRLAHRLPIDEVSNSFNKWMLQYYQPEAIAVDGKSIRSTVRNSLNQNQAFTSLVSFFGHKSQLIYQIGVLQNDKSSEIHVVQELLSKLQIEKALFTFDALHCQTKTAESVISSGNNYLMTVKNNQPSLYRAISEKTESKPDDAYSWKQTGHGHDTTCRIKLWKADEEMKNKWSGLSHYVSVRRRGQRDGKEFDTTTYYITSTNTSAWCLAQDIRGHRKIENNLHWTKDVVLVEDACRLADSQCASNMAVMRDIGFNLLVMAGYKSISEGISAMGEKIGTLFGLISGIGKETSSKHEVSKESCVT